MNSQGSWKRFVISIICYNFENVFIKMSFGTKIQHNCVRFTQILIFWLHTAIIITEFHYKMITSITNDFITFFWQVSWINVPGCDNFIAIRTNFHCSVDVFTNKIDSILKDAFRRLYFDFFYFISFAQWTQWTKNDFLNEFEFKTDLIHWQPLNVITA